MKRFYRATPLISVMLMLSFFVFTAGCDKHTKYKILTFFFTGVPLPVEDSKDKQAPSEGEAAQKKKKRPPAQEIAFFDHGPYAAGQCHLCHKTAAPPGTKAEKQSFASWGEGGGGAAGKLVSPLKELCTECHPDKSVKSASARDLWIHGPVSDGLCTACHGPHQSRFKYILLEGKTTDLCGRCHGKGFIAETEDHKQGQECISCHNAHVGKDRFLLKKDFNEVY